MYTVCDNNIFTVKFLPHGKKSFATQDPFSRVQRQVENVFDLFMVVPSTASACQNVWAVFSYCSAEFQEV